MRRVVITLIVAICIGAPIAETFDRWDHTYQDGNDTEANLVIVALCIGAALTIAATVKTSIRPVFSIARALPAPARALLVGEARRVRPLPSISPPTQLRV